jgi:ABC-type glutathione transport system ATPase component
VGSVRAVDGVSFDLAAARPLAWSASRAAASPPPAARFCAGRADAGHVRFDGHDLPAAARALRPLRRHMQMIFQDPFASLNPRHDGSPRSSAEPLQLHGLAATGEAEARVKTLMEKVGLPASYSAATPTSSRAGSASASASPARSRSRPEFIVCDEPISALDVSIQAQVVNLLLDLQRGAAGCPTCSSPTTWAW